MIGLVGADKVDMLTALAHNQGQTKDDNDTALSGDLTLSSSWVYRVGTRLTATKLCANLFLMICLPLDSMSAESMI